MSTYTCTRCSSEQPLQLPNSCVGNYAVQQDGSKICYACAGDLDAQAMRDTGKAVLYFDSAKRTVTNFPGTLRIPLTVVKSGSHNFARARYDYWFFFNGYVWHGYTIGNNTQKAHCKQTKIKLV